MLDVRLAKFAEIAPWFSLSVQANWRFVRISATSRRVVNMLVGVSYTKEAPIQLLGKIKIETNDDLCPRSAQSLACPRPAPTPPCHKSNALTPTESAIGEFETILYDAFGTQIG